MMNASALRVSHWLGLFVAPVAFLTLVAVAYMLVPWACATHRLEVLHAAAGITLLVILGVLAAAWRARERTAVEGEGMATERFVAAMNVGTSALFALATVALWFTAFVISPCLA